MLVGPSGCGKTTTLKMINRLIEPTSGRILLDGEDVTHGDPVALRRRMGYVIQQVGLFPHQDDRAPTSPPSPGCSAGDATGSVTRVDELLELVGLDPAEYRDRYPAQLSGGQRQRVGVAARSAADPPVLLMDEPFGAIDPVTRARLQDEFLRLQAEVRKTVVFVTHDIEEAVKMGDRIAILERRRRARAVRHARRGARPPGVADRRRLRRRRPRPQAAQGHRIDPRRPRPPAELPPGRIARRGARAHGHARDVDWLAIVDDDGNIRGHLPAANA